MTRISRRHFAALAGASTVAAAMPAVATSSAFDGRGYIDALRALGLKVVRCPGAEGFFIGADVLGGGGFTDEFFQVHERFVDKVEHPDWIERVRAELDRESGTL